MDNPHYFAWITQNTLHSFRLSIFAISFTYETYDQFWKIDNTVDPEYKKEQRAGESVKNDYYIRVWIYYKSTK